jgi:hypothetical protein
MKFSFEVGNEEKHSISFEYDRKWGKLFILIDGREAIKDIIIASFTLTKQYTFYVGIQERNKIVIEKERKLFFAGFRKQKYRIYVNDILVEEIEGL